MMLERLIKIKRIAAGLLLLVIMLFFVFYSIGYGSADVEQMVVKDAVITVDGKTVTGGLPFSQGNLPHGTEVTISFDTCAENGKHMFFGSVYAPLKIYANNEKIYEYGQEGTYPAFMKDPPTQYDSVLLPSNEKTVHIKMVYYSPDERDTLSVHEPVLGTSKAIRRFLFGKYGINLVISLFFVLSGMVISVLSVAFRKTENFGWAVLFPGLFSLFAGMWQFGENTLSVYLVQNPTLLYFIDFLGLFLLMIPLYATALFYLNKKGNILLESVLSIIELANIVAVILQITGTVSFHRSLFAFHIMLPIAMVLLFGYSLYDTIKNKNRNAKLFMIPFFVLSVSAILELVNYYLHITKMYSVIFQMGVFAFAVIMTILSVLYILNLIADKRKKAELEIALRIRDQVLSYQKSRLEMLISMADKIRNQRHDLRHHLHTIDDLIEKKHYDKAKAYISTVTNTIPCYSLKVWCENPVVNSTISYYAQLAETEHIRLDIVVEIPDFNPSISNSNLCVIFGNLLENAIEACRLINSESRYIKLYSKVNWEMLFISMDNSFNGVVHMKGEEFLSNKHTGVGTGLRSILSLAESYDGSAEFKISENRFRSEVCVKL